LPKLRSTTARGYGNAHQKLRARWAREIKAGGVSCARCGRPIPPGALWDLGHHDTDRRVYTGPEHRYCNRRAAANKVNRQRRQPRPQHSRAW
jgi:hypothetical protein